MNRSSIDKPARLFELDLLRGFAVIGMIETHLFNEGIRPALEFTWPAHALNFLNGLVAPLFLLVTGVILEIRSPATRLEYWQRFSRFGWWFLLGTAMHLPGWNGEKEAIDWAPLLHFDILHCLAVSGAILTLLQVASPRHRALTFFAATLVILLACLAVDRSHVAVSLPNWVQGWVVHNDLSRFPVLPWTAFMTAGAFFTQISCPGGVPVEKRRLELIAVGVALFGYGCFALSISPASAGWTLDGRAHPLFFLLRLAIVALSIHLAFLYRDFLQKDLFGPIVWLGRHSLWIYILHLEILFIQLPVSLASRLSRRLDFESVLLLTACLCLASMGLLWSIRKLAQKIRLAKLELKLL